MGSLLAVINYNWLKYRHHESRKLQVPVEALGLGSCVALIFLIPSVTYYFRGVTYTYIPFVIYGVLWSVVLFSCVNGVGMLRRFFELPFLRYLGFISFSMYLMHLIVWRIIWKYVAGSAFKGWIILIFSIAVSHIAWILIEKPTSRIKFTRMENKA
jgi:peptidoglycan/LPS O-acetylase OafA/YrhL